MRLVPLLTFAAIAVSLIGFHPSAQAGPLPDNGLVDYQLGGGYPPSSKVTIVVRDSTDKPVPGLFNICYVNGFQTQPGRVWPADLLVPGPDGKPLVDLGWPDEFLLDVSTETSRQLNLARVNRSIDMCVEKASTRLSLTTWTHTRVLAAISIKRTHWPLRSCWLTARGNAVCPQLRRTRASLVRGDAMRLDSRLR